MSATTPTSAPPKGRKGIILGRQLELVQLTPEARRQAAAVLEVLTGLRTPPQAAQALSISLPTYYNLETRALRALVFACTPHPPGRQHSLARQLREAQHRCRQLEKDLQRYQGLVRTAQRSMGLAALPVEKVPQKGQRKPRKPTVRALRAVQTLQHVAGAAPADSAVGESCAPVVAEAG